MGVFTRSFNLTYDDGVEDALVMALVSRTGTPTTKRPVISEQSVGTSSEAVLLGDTAALGGCLAIKNLDQTNYVDVYNESAGKHIARLRPDADGDGKGGFCILEELGADTLAPFVKANSATCKIRVFIQPP